MISPIFAKYAEEFANIVCIKVDVDVVSDAAETAQIRAMPTFQVYQNNQKVDELVGANQAKLLELMRKYNNSV
ncbi:hypothetical protein HDU82_000781 [Entophlyctis luteolus]|nr:hypothetical protein HDU82_000781 [Entophlyctis luteolus]